MLVTGAMTSKWIEVASAGPLPNFKVAARIGKIAETGLRQRCEWLLRSSYCRSLAAVRRNLPVG